MLMKSVKGSLAFLISISLLTLVVPFSANADSANQPHINYSDNTGLSFAVAPASISGLKNAKLQWFINGKAVAGATKPAFKATAKQKNQSIQVKATEAGVTTASVVGRIGQVIVNVKPTVALVNPAGNKLVTNPGEFSPKTAKVTYQWYKGPVEIDGAKLATYSPAGIDEGFRVYVTAKFSAKGFADNKIDSSEFMIPVIKRNYVHHFLFIKKS